MKALSCFLLMIAIYISFSGEALAQYACVRAAAPVEVQGSIAEGDNLQLGRVTRTGKASTCQGDSAPLEHNAMRRRDTHNFVNPYNETVCVRVEQDFTGCGGSQMQSVAYSSFVATNPAANVIGHGGFSSSGRGSYSFSVGPNASFSIGVNELDQNAGCPLYKLKVSYLRDCRQPGMDLTNDGLADITQFRSTPDGGMWYTLDSETQQPVVREFGLGSDVPVSPGDYTGDGRSDLSVYRQPVNTWYYATNPVSPESNFIAQSWGVPNDKVVPGDYDADGKNDIAIFRPAEGKFYILRSSDGAMQSHQWGSSTDQMVTGDFDGDTVADIAIARNQDGGKYWWILKSNYNHGFHEVMHWGLTTDRLVPADFDGDAITDLAIYRSSTGTFYVRRSSDASMQAFKWGVDGDVPQPADYDGDMKVDFAVFRPSNGTWYIHNSDSGTTRVVNWGLQFDQPMTTPYRIPGAVQIGQSLVE